MKLAVIYESVTGNTKQSKESRIALQKALSFALQGDYFFMGHLSASDISESIFSRYAASITIL